LLRDKLSVITRFVPLATVVQPPTALTAVTTLLITLAEPCNNEAYCVHMNNFWQMRCEIVTFPGW
jgi:hypothetical protein